LFFPEFRAVEESFHLLMQVSGRAGRGEHHGKVYIQSYNPDHYAIRFAQGQYYKKFYDVESRLRRKLAYPPFGGLIGINFRGADLMQVTSVSLRVAEIIRSAAPKVTILGPVSSHPEKVKNIFRRQLTLKGSSRTMLQESLRALWPEIKNICGISVHAYAVVY
ncbi:MAG: primosomal protein N', partial [bacterium]|nr:primosomal protein N' [bacterium]